MTSLLVKARDRRHHKVDHLWELPLEPLDYCQRWVKTVDPNSRGYRKACIAALAKATNLSELTIKDWGENFAKRPNYVLHMLRMADMLNQIKAIIEPNTNELNE